MVQRRRATWVDGQKGQRVFIFDSLNNLMIARLDFALKFKHSYAEEAIPASYEIEEVAHEGNTYQRARCTLLRW
jgi:hypothetical protein